MVRRRASLTLGCSVSNNLIGGGGGGGTKVAAAAANNHERGSGMMMKGLLLAESYQSSRSMSVRWHPQKFQQESREASLKLIRDEIKVQQDRQNEMQNLVEHHMQLAAARLESDNQLGAVISMKQVIRYEAEKVRATQAMNSLDDLIVEFNMMGMTPSAVESQIESILAVPAKPSLPTNKAQILQELRVRLDDKALMMAVHEGPEAA